MIYVFPIHTLLFIPLVGYLETELTVTSPHILQECVGELYPTDKMIRLTCKTLGGEYVDYTITGIYEV